MRETGSYAKPTTNLWRFTIKACLRAIATWKAESFMPTAPPWRAMALLARTSSANYSGRPAGGTWPKPGNGFGKHSNKLLQAHRFAENLATFLGTARCASLILLLYR